MTPEMILPHGVLDRLLPMHLAVGADGKIEHAAPTFRRICPSTEPVGLRFFDLLEVDRPLKLVERWISRRWPARGCGCGFGAGRG